MEREEDDGRCLGYFKTSEVCFDRLFASLLQYKNANGNLIISTSDPCFDSIMDDLSAAGIEKLLKERFYNQLDLLKDFSKEHGDCLVPNDHPTLGEWVRMQRRHSKLFEKRLPGPLTKKRFAELGEILGFVDFESSVEEQKDELIERRPTPTDVLSPAEILALDRKIHLKTVANKVRIMNKTSKVLSSSKKSRPPVKNVAVVESAESLALNEKIRMRKAARKDVLMAKQAKSTAAFSDSKNLPGKEAIAAELEKKRPGRTRQQLSERNRSRRIKPQVDVYRSLQLNDVFESDGQGLNSEVREGIAPLLYSSMPDIPMVGTSKDEKLAASDSKTLPGKEAIAAELEKKRPGRTQQQLSERNRSRRIKPQADVHRSLQLNDAFDSGSQGLNSEAREGIAPLLYSSMPDIPMVGTSIDEKLDTVLDAYEEKIRKKMLAEENCSSSTSQEETRKKTGQQDRSSFVPESSANDAIKIKQQPRVQYRPALSQSGRITDTFDDRLRQKLAGGNLEDIYTDQKNEVESTTASRAPLNVQSDEIVGSDDQGLNSSTRETDAPPLGSSMLDVSTTGTSTDGKLAKKHWKKATRKMLLVVKSANSFSSYKKLPEKDVIEATTQEKKIKKSKQQLDDHKSTQLDEAFGSDGQSLNSDAGGNVTVSLSSSSTSKDEKVDTVFDVCDVYEEKIRKKLLAEENCCSSTSQKATRKKMGQQDRSTSMPEIFTNGAIKIKRQSRVQYRPALSQSERITDTFDDRLRRKLAGEDLEDIYKNQQNKEELTAASLAPLMVDDSNEFTDDDSLGSQKAISKKPGVEDRSSSVLVRLENGVIRKQQGSGILYREPSLPSETTPGTFDDRLRRKLAGETLEDIYQDQQNEEESDPACGNALNTANDSLGLSALALERTSWSSIKSILPSVKKFSRWKLLFENKGYGDKEDQSECVSSVLNDIIYPDKWNIIPKANGDVALEITTDTVDEHKMVELYVRELDHLYSRADFFFC